MSLSMLHHNPFAVEARFDLSCTLTYAIPLDEVTSRLPRGLEADKYEAHGRAWGFMAVAVVQTRGLRPSFLPSLFGNDFILLGYRFFVRCTLSNGRKLRGLYILRSETDKRSMVRLGNWFTSYRYSYSSLNLQLNGEDLMLRAFDSPLDVQVKLGQGESSPLPPGSPFPDWKTARKFCGPMPFTFSAPNDEGELWMVEGKRTNWVPEPVEVIEHHIPSLAQLGFSEYRLANAFIVRDIPYRWERGRKKRLA